MFRIELYQSPVGPDQILQFVNGLGETTERTDAIRLIEQYIAGYTNHSHHEEQDCWRCRNKGGDTVYTLMIRGI